MSVTLEKIGDSIATITLNDGKVNIMTKAVWDSLYATLKQAESDPSIRAIIYRSGLSKNVFTAGNDITELYAPNTTAQRYAAFWLSQNKFLAALAGSPLVTIAVVKGACPAGGCALSLCCDFRFLTTDVTSGLNEARIGISVPGYWQKMMAHVAGEKTAERMCSLGFMLPAAALKECGIADQIHPDARSNEDAAIKFVKEVLEVPDAGRVISKLQSRGGLVKEWGDEGRINQEAADKWPFLSSAPVVAALGATLARLQKPKSKI